MVSSALKYIHFATMATKVLRSAWKLYEESTPDERQTHHPTLECYLGHSTKCIPSYERRNSTGTPDVACTGNWQT